MISNLKKTTPLIPVGHPDFKWSSGADVQTTWRKYGWVPPSELRTTPLPPQTKVEPAFVTLRRFK
jgi:hypothetical protein